MPAKKNKSESELSRQLREAIGSAGITRYAIADKAGVPQSAIDRFFNRDRSLSLDTAGRVAEALGLSLKKSR